ncbi:DUF4055 domain-containing protein [Phormidium tenue FACHB-886]|nr:DUF4055 domain-containing protein [Phormidium tenue FACHB-886]
MPTPPTNDKTLPSFVKPALLDVLDDLQLVWDVWHSLKGCKAEYLPQEEREPPKAYTNRLKRTRFDNRYTPAIKGYAGLLTQFALLEDTAETIASNIENIDQQGNSLKAFLLQADEMVLRDGGCGILVEFPIDPTDETGEPLIQSAADEQEFGLRPYVVLIDRRNILNWDVSYIQGIPVINRVTIAETVEVPDGEFGCTMRTRYRVLRPGSYQVWELQLVQGQWIKYLVDEGVTNLDRVPLIWYSLSKGELFKGSLPFQDVAELNIEHFQKRSENNEVLRKCNLPVPVRKGYQRSPEEIKSGAKLTIGPNSLVDVPVDGDFYFAEPTGNAIASTQANITALEEAIDRLSLAFLTGGEAQKTATEVIIDSAQCQSSLQSMAERKASAVQQVFEFWTQYTGEEAIGGIAVDAKVLKLPSSAQDVQVILDAMGLKISNKLGLQMLLERGWLPEETDLEEELQLIEEVQPALATVDNKPLASGNQIDEEAANAA